MMNEMLLDVALCRACKGAAYQTPGLGYCGDPLAPILVIAQNPGEISSKDALKLDSAKTFAQHVEEHGRSVTPEAIKLWYHGDFEGSNGYKRLEAVFGPRWTVSGMYLYTNAVRCRTEGNAAPSGEMQVACSVWTRQLVLRPQTRAIIFIGAMARKQLLGAEEEKLPNGVVKTHPRFGYVLALPHYIMWKRTDVDEYRVLVDTILGKLR